MSDPFREQVQSSLGSAYTLERELGGGGMSRVFVARDTALGRTVVIKVLAPELSEDLSADRFAREIRLAARLQHPNIVPLLTAGVAVAAPYYVMPFVDGDSLRARLQAGRLELAEAVSILRDVVKALAYSHRSGVVHRDMKPENVLLTDGTAVVTDFGVAKAISAASTRAVPPRVDGATQGLTRLGTTVGTPAYMAPEQAAGEPDVDLRADLYSWGVVAWELLAGRHPFEGKRSAMAYIAAHITETPLPLAAQSPGTPVALAELVMRCLAKDPAERPGGAAELLPALDAALATDESGRRGEGTTRGASMPMQAPMPAVAVLPFANLSSDPENEYLSDGITDEIIFTLGRIDGVRVAGRTSCFALKDQRLDAATLGRRLNVTSVVNGSVRRAGGRVRVQAELVSAADGFQLWSERYDRDLSDVFAVQEEIARSVVAALRGRLGAPAHVTPAASPTSDVEAYELYLRGRHAWSQRTTASSVSAVQYLEQAVARDPMFARAWAGLADAYLAAPIYTGSDRSTAWSRARVAAERALAVDSRLGEAHTSLAYGTMLYEWKWKSAEESFHRAIAASPRYPTAHHWYADFLAGRGRLEESLHEMTQARDLDPLSPMINVELAWVLGLLRRTDAALAQVDQVLRLDPNFAHAHFVRGLVQQALGDYPLAIASQRRALELGGFYAFAHAALISACASSGDREEARRLLEELRQRANAERVPSFAFALAFTGLGAIDEAFAWLDRAIEERDELLAENFFDPLFDGLRGDARYDRVLARLRTGS